MLIAITVPATNEKGPVYTQQFLAALHQANTKRLPITLRIAQNDKTVGLQCRFPDELEQTIKKQLVARYHDCRIDDLLGDPLIEHDLALIRFGRNQSSALRTAGSHL